MICSDLDGINWNLIKTAWGQLIIYENLPCIEVSTVYSEPQNKCEIWYVTLCPPYIPRDFNACVSEYISLQQKFHRVNNNKKKKKIYDNKKNIRYRASPGESRESLVANKASGARARWPRAFCCFRSRLESSLSRMGAWGDSRWAAAACIYAPHLSADWKSTRRESLRG